MIRDFNGHLARKETTNYGVFSRQLLDMFNVIMALDKLKADTRMIKIFSDYVYRNEGCK